MTTRHRTLLMTVVVFGLFAMLASSAFALPIGRTPVPGWQANGRVLTILRVKNTVYIGGDFTQVMSHGGGVTASRNHLAAFNALTGAVLPWNPNPDGRVRALAATANGGIIIAGGDFTHVSGAAHSRVAELPPGGSGKALGWSVSANGIVRTVKAFNSKVYMGGDFTAVNSKARSRLAAVAVSGGALQGWVPKANGAVRVLLVSPAGSRIFVGGDFTTMNGGAQAHLTAVGPNLGGLSPWPAASHPGGGVNALVVTSVRLFAADSGGGGHVRAYSLANNKLQWTNTTDGNVEGLGQMGNDVIAGGHFNKMGAFQRKHLGAIDKKTGKVDPTWVPEANSALGVFSTFTWNNVLYVGGDFTQWQPGNINQAHFAEFS